MKLFCSMLLMVVRGDALAANFAGDAQGAHFLRPAVISNGTSRLALNQKQVYGQPAETFGGYYTPGVAHTGQWYKTKCTEIKMRCETRKGEIERSEEDTIRRLEEEYKHETKVKEEAQEDAEAAESTVRKHKKTVTKHEEQVEESKTVYERTKKCPEEMQKLEEDLQRLESEENDSEEDIDAECEKRKEILKKKKCVDEFYESRERVRTSKTTYSEATQELSEEERRAQAAADAAKRTEEHTDSAKKRLEEQRRQGASKRLGIVEEECIGQMYVLKRLADQEVKDAEERYKEHQKVLTGEETEYKETREDVEEQRRVVKTYREKVEEAKVVYKQKKDCPAELEKAEEELERLQSVPNESEEDIDEECQKKKEILEKKKCVDEFIEASNTMTKTESEYTVEENDLQHHTRISKTAKTSVKTHEQTVKEGKEEWERTRAHRRVLLDCSDDLEGSLAESGSASEGGQAGQAGQGGQSRAGRADLMGTVLALLIAAAAWPMMLA